MHETLQRIKIRLIIVLEYAFTVAIVQHNVPDFIYWKCGESSLFKVYSHCDSVIALVLIQLHSNPLSLTMDTIIMLLSQLHSNPLSSIMAL